MTPEELDAAVFWDQIVCIDCENVQDAGHPDECTACGSTRVFFAETLKEIVEKFGGDGA